MPRKTTLKEYRTSIGFTLKILDAVAILLAGISSYLWGVDEEVINSSYTLSFLVAALVLEFIFTSLGAYQNWRNSSITQEFRLTVLGSSLTFLVLVSIAFFTHTFTLLPRSWIAIWFLGTILLITLFRLAARRHLNHKAKQGSNIEKVLIVGNGRLGRQVAEKLLSQPDSGLQPIGFISDQASEHSKLKVLGGIEDLERLMEQENVHQVWIALPMSEVATMTRVQEALATSLATVRMVPDLYGFHLINHSVSDIAGMPVINLSFSPMVEGKNRIVKRLEDLILASLILLAVSPLMLFIAIAVKLTSPGPVFYRQERVSWNGKPFNMLKFRSMAIDSEANGVSWGGAQNKSVTSIGRWLRKTSLDELPQFFNVLKGEMSIIGPRPERTIFVEQFKHRIPGYMQKHMVKAGISGWAQVNGWRGDTDLKKRIECDLYYIENWSIWLDLKIILLTLLKGFGHKNAK